jgi:hypothetical protein
LGHIQVDGLAFSLFTTGLCVKNLIYLNSCLLLVVCC